MSAALTYDPSAALKFLKAGAREALAPKLEAARMEVIDDVAILTSKGPVPADKNPLDAGFIDWPARLLAGDENGLLRKIEESAKRFREQVDRMVVLGIGGSYMGLRALFEGLCNPYHNQLTREQRGGVPTLHFEGDNLDNDSVAALLDLLKTHCKDPKDLAQRWGIVVISKSGGTLETAAAFRIFRDALETYYGAGSELAKKLVVPVTGETGKLRSISNGAGYPDTFPIPDGIGGRFSVLTAVGLFPAAVLGIDIRALLQGAAAITTTFKTAPLGQNPVLDYTGICHLLERDSGMDVRILSTWGKKLEACGLWYDQLLAESLGKHERGALPLTVVNTRDLHSRGQQHQEGKRDKLITNVIVDKASLAPVKVPQVAADRDQDQLNRLGWKGMPDLLAAAIAGTNKAYADDDRPTADIHLPKLDAYAVGQFLQMMMLATAVEGRLIGINPYGQPGVEAYKKNMGEILYGK
ncbi:Glucose-6-phosphate isomerase B [Caulifigura coniformis]|uniref:Glucose-6-phosphate isomerase n=2 Tax=Caulifigura coniformis TaxID=2527983 RepID=A0A517SIU0_9PLAN|nr:Glucose-6-phosphate isomerase B [Caulifigura coniformis]